MKTVTQSDNLGSYSSDLQKLPDFWDVTLSSNRSAP